MEENITISKWDTGFFSTGITTSVDFYNYGEPDLLNYQIFDDRVEFIYKQSKTCRMWSGDYQPVSTDIVYKIVVTFENGKTVQTRIEGKLIPAQEESYEFDTNE